MATKQPETLKVKILRPFRVNGLDPQTSKGYDENTQVIGKDSVVVLPYGFARQMITAGKAEESKEQEVKKEFVPETKEKKEKK